MNNGTMEVVGSTISGNRGGNYGGGISNWNTGKLGVYASTITGNSAWVGGGIWNVGELELSNSIVANNSSDIGDEGTKYWSFPLKLSQRE